LDWYNLLSSAKSSGLKGVELYMYTNTGSNNADLPKDAFRLSKRMPVSAQELTSKSKKNEFEKIFETTQLFIAPTEYSATAPLKIAARRFGFRAATMPGFSAEMIPALRIDYDQVAVRVKKIKNLLDEAESAQVNFFVDNVQNLQMNFDLRHRSAHESSGLLSEPGTAGNLPSGEAYIVPYEGEQEPSLTQGILPVQMNDEIVLYRIRNNQAVAVASYGIESLRESDYLIREPAYGNMAELGFGVLSEFDIKPLGETLLDEKLGIHIAFGRSDHFGGMTGAAQFSSPQAVVHIDRIYIPEVQPLVLIHSVIVKVPDKQEMTIFKNGKYFLE
jgi:leucyl aminopeptidase (aminopeptidase T)